MTGETSEGKNEIFKNGTFKGDKKITGRYNTSKPLTEVKISCPCGLKWTWQEDVTSLEAQKERERRRTTWIKKCTAIRLPNNSER